MPLAPVALVITGAPGTTLMTVKTIPVLLASDRTVNPELLIVAKLPVSELLVRIANCWPTTGR